MPYTLQTWHVNPRKLGQILKQYIKESGYTVAHIQHETGISRDTIDNILSGKVQEVTFEKLLKICCSIHIPMTAVKMMLLADEDIDFRDRISIVDVSTGDVLPATDVDPSQLPVPETVKVAAEAVAAAEKPPEPARPGAHTEEYVLFLQQHISQLTSLLEMALRKGD